MNTRKLLALSLALALVLALCAGCAAGGNQAALVGVWELTDGEDTGFGFGLKFNKDKTLYYGLSSAEVGSTTRSDDEWEQLFESLSMLYTISYEVLSDEEIEITMKLLGGLGSTEKTTVAYSLDGDTLLFDGATYRRVR